MTGAPANTRPCGSCRHLDGRADNTLQAGGQYCWRWYVWRRADEVVAECTTAERADGGEPPGRLYFEGERKQ